MRTKMFRLILICASISLGACSLFTTQAPNVILVSPIVHTEVTVAGETMMVPSDLVVIGPGKIKVFIKTKDGLVLSNNEVSLAGWLAAPPPPKKEE